MKKFLIVFIALGLSITILGCSGTTTTASLTTTSVTTAETTTTGATDLVIYSNFGSEVSEKQIYQDNIISQFETDHNCTVHFETLSGTSEIFNKISSEQIAGIHSVDLVITDFGTMSQYIQAGYVQSLNDLEAQMSDRHFLTAFDGSTNFGDFRFFFPINSDVYLAYAANAAFDHLPAGLTKAEVLAGDYTWDQYVAWGNELGAGSVFMKGLPVKQLIYQVGGMALSNGGSFPALNDAGNLKAWQDILSMKDSINASSLTEQVSSALMASGSVQLAFDHMANVATTYVAAPLQFSVFPGPKGTTGSAGSIAGGHGIAIVKDAPHQQLAEDFIKWMTAPAQIVYAALGTIPTLQEATTVLTDSPADQIIKMGISTVANANVEGLQMIPSFTSWSGVKGCYDAIFAGIMDGSITTANLQAKLDEQQANLDAIRK